jgi:guanylate kinase
VDARYVFIAPPSFEALESRLRGRGTEKEESIQKRLEQAKLELDFSKTEGVHDTIIVNDDKEVAYRELEAFIFGKDVGKTQVQLAKDGQLAGESVQD